MTIPCSRTVKTETSTIFATVAVLFLREIWSLTYLFIYAVAQSVWLIFKSSIRARARLRHEVPFIKSWSAVSSSAQEHSGSVVRNGCQCSCHLSLGAVSPRVKNKRHLAADNHFHVAVVAASTYWRLWADKGAVIRYARSLSLYHRHHHFICSQKQFHKNTTTGQHANGTDKASLALTVAPIKKERRKQELLSLWMYSDTIPSRYDAQP